MHHSTVVKGELARHYANNYYAIEDDVFAVFEKIDTPLLDGKMKPGMKVFDAMMGRGRHAIRYAKRDCIVWGNDLNPYMVALARKGARRARAKAKFSAIDVRHLKGVPSGHFDVTIAMFSALGTIPKSKDRQRAMHEFSRITKKGGMVIVHAHNRLDTFFEYAMIATAVQISFFPEKGLEPGDVVTSYNGLNDMFNHFYTPSEFRESFVKVGLKVVEEHYMDYEKRKIIHGVLRKLGADGFIFVGRKE
jgi:ubiquinone/menaquinone biosynthesis C-methylase UbiE